MIARHRFRVLASSRNWSRDLIQPGRVDGKKMFEKFLCGNQLRHLMTAIFGEFRITDAFKTVS